MSFFDDSHVTDVGLQGSAGPSVGLGEIFQQSMRQQFRVDSALALDTELRTRWLDSLRKAQIQQTAESDPDRFAYAAFAQSSQGHPIDVVDLNPWEGDLTERFKGMATANDAIKKLNNPEIKSFEQILEEVAQMQHEVEGDTASMYERSGTGGFVASLLGAMVGSFSTRDPLNIATAPIGAGRTVVTRIASDMAIAAGVTGVTEVLDVAPARRIVGLPEHDIPFNIAAATIGAGVIRGGIEGIGYGVSRLRSENIDFDLRDSQLRQMFEANADKPSARAGASILDDVTFIERNNPYGGGHQANARFLAELQSVQRAMNGEPMTAVARVMPMVPYDYIKKSADFEIVREQAPQVYAKLEAAQAKVSRLGTVPDNKLMVTDRFPNDPPGVQKYYDVEAEVGGKNLQAELNLDRRGSAEISIWGLEANELGPGQLRELARSLIDEVPEIRELRGVRVSGTKADARSRGTDQDVDEMIISADSLRASVGRERRVANKEYHSAYREVEAEAARIRDQQVLVEAAQQRESVNILASQGLPFTGPLLRRDSVEELVNRINTFNDGLDERTAARFVRETLGEGENKVEVEVWEKDGGIDIGLKDPVDPNFRFVTDEGEMTVAQAMRDLQDDADLVEAIKGCAI